MRESRAAQARHRHSRYTSRQSQNSVLTAGINRIKFQDPIWSLRVRLNPLI